MVSCLLCGKEYNTQRSLFAHLSRVHDIRDQNQKLSLYIIADFFPLIEKRSWTAAETLLQELKTEIKNTEWTNGYILALEGMISAHKEGGSVEPYILTLKDCNYKQLQEVKTNFSEFNKKLAPKQTFDAAYFQAWNDFTYYKMNSKI